MVAIVGGNALGLNLGSLSTLGQRGAYGSALTGRNAEQAYVNAATGNLVLQDRDEMLRGQGLSVESLRTYNSLGSFADDNGDNWTQGMPQLRLFGTANAAGSSMVRTDRDGSQATYTFDATLGQYVSTEGSGAHDRISITANAWVRTDGDTGVQEDYAQGSGRLVSMRDPSGNTVTYAYDSASGLLRSATKSDGEATYYDYVGNNLSQVRSTYAKDGATQTLTRTRYGYDTSNRLTSVTVDLTPEDNAIADGKTYVTTYTYDGTSKRIASVTQSDGSRLTFAYQPFGADHRVSSITDALGQVTRFEYDIEARRTTVVDPLGLRTRYDYSATGQLVRVASVSGSAVLQSVGFAYNEAGDVTGVTDGLGRTVTFEYDASGNQLLQRDAAGNTVTRTFDARNQVLTETVYAVPDADGAGAAQPSAPQTTRYVYDTSGRRQLRFVLSPEGRVTEHVYDVKGLRTATLSYVQGVYGVSALAATAAPTLTQMTSWVSAQNRSRLQRVDLSYDARGQLQTTTTYANTTSAGVGLNDGAQSVTRYVYDQAGLLLQTVSPTQGTTQYTYDGLGRVLTSTDALGQVTVTSHDDAGNRMRIALASGLVTTQTYDRAGRLVAVQQTDAASRQLGQTQYFYDADNRLRMTQDPTGVRHWMLYDDAGRKVADIDGNGSLIELVYNANGQVTQQIEYATAVDVSGLVDTAGQPLDVALAAIRPPANAADRRAWNAYDAAGRLVKTVDGEGGVTQTTYDGASRVVQVTRYAAKINTAALGAAPTPEAIAPAADPAADRTTRNLYDQDGRLVGELDAEGYLTEHQYDAAGRRTVTLGYATATSAALRADGTLAQLRPATSTDDIRTVTLYDGKGQVVGVVDGQNILTERVYDASGNLVRQVRYHPAFTTTVASTSTLAAIRPQPGTGREQQVKSWVYDTLNRVTQMTDVDGTVTDFAYDKAGNLVTTTRAVGQAEVRSVNARYDLQGRLIGELSAEGGALLTGGQTQAQIDAIWAQYGIAHTYDAAGRRTSTTDQNGLKTLFFYNADGRLTHTVNPLGEVQEHRYDALGQLESTVRYNKRITMAGLAGGLAGSAISNAIAAVVDAARDSRVSYTYDRTGGLASRTEALTRGTSAVTRYAYDAFGGETSRITDLGGGVTRTDTTTWDRRGLRIGTVSDAGGLAATTGATYDAFGRQITTTDANGRVRSQRYDRLGRVVQTTDANGRTRSTTYDAFDRVLTQTDALGQITRYAHDTAARSTTVTTPEGVTVTTVRNRHGQTLSIRDGKGQVTSYTYDRDGRLTGTTTPLTSTSQAYDRAGRLIETTDARGVKVAYGYDNASRVLRREVDPGGLALVTTYEYDAQGRQVRETDPQRVVTLTEFDRAGRVVAQTVDEGGLNLRTAYALDATGNVLTVTSPRGTVTEYAYDKLGRRERESVNLGQTQLVTRYRYDAQGNVVARTAANGGVTRYTYDGENRLQFTVDAMGNTTRREYDAEGRITRTTGYAQPISLAQLPQTPSSDQVLALVVAAPGRDAVEANRYDRDGRLRYTVDGTGAVTEFRYDANGNVVERIAYAKVINLAGWNGSTNPPVSADPARDLRTRIVYDALNRATHEADALGAVTEREYDGNGNVVRLIQHATTVAADASPSTVTASADDRVTVFRYDRANRETWRADAAGAVTRSEYDPDGNLVRSTRFASTITPGSEPSSVKAQDGADRVTRHVYDRAGRRTHAVDALNYVTRWVYDRDGNVESTTRYATAIEAGKDATSVASLPTLDQTDTYVRDAAGRVLSHTDAMGYTESTTYDALGHKLTYTNAKGSVWTYEYDAAGRMTVETSPGVAVTAVNQSGGALTQGEIVEASIVTRFEYDALGNLTSRTEAAGRAEQRQTLYGYDARGRQVSVTYPAVGVYSEAVTALAANGLSAAATRAEQVRTLSTRTYYDPLGNAVANVDVGGAPSFKAYDAAGRVVYEVDALGYVTAYTRNAFGEATGVLRYAVATTLASTVPTSAAQAPTAAAVAAKVNATGVDHSADRLLTTRYDALGRAVEVTEPEAFNYDSATGQYSVAGKTTRHTYNAYGDLIQTRVLGSSPADSRFYYDRLGRQTASVDALGYVTERAYDAAGNLVSNTEFSTRAEAGSWSATAYARPTRHTDDRVTTYTYDQANRKTSETRVAARLNEGTGGTADLVTRYGYDAVGNLTRTTDATGASTYSYYDALGRVTAVAEPTRPGANGQALTPLSIFLRDAHGNVAVKLDLANGAAAASEFTGVSRLSNPGFVLGAGSTDDRRTVTRFDALGRAVELTDAQGVSRYTSYDAYGHLAKNWQSIVTDGVTRTLYQAFQYDRLGRLTHTLDPAPYSGLNPTGGVTDTALDYDAFGDVVRKRVNNQVQEFNDYDRAGRLWRTNSGDGVVKVYLYDVQGRNTAEIRSSGSGRDDIDLAAPQMSPAMAAGLSTARRTDTTYDALGRAVARSLPERLESQGGVSVHSKFTTVNVSAVSGTVQSRVDLGWSTLARLGTGDIRVEIEYLTQVDEEHPEVLGGSQSHIYTADEASAGVSMVWSDPAGRPVGEITKLTVWKEDVHGVWQRVIDQSTFGFAGNTVEVALPDDPSTSMRVEMRSVGGTWARYEGTNFGNALYFDASTLGLGQYEYRITTDRVVDGKPQSVVTASGTLSLTTPPLADIAIPIGYGAAGEGVLAWQAPGSGVKQALNYRRAGSLDAWTSLSVASRSVTHDGVDTSVLPSGTYEFELLWTQEAANLPYAHATGTMTVVAAVPTREVPATGVPNITGITATNTAVSWDTALGAGRVLSDTTRGYVGGYDVTASTLSWTPPNGGTVRLVGRAIGTSDWAEVQVARVDGRDRIDISALAGGDYEFVITYTENNAVSAMGSGRLHAPSQPTLGGTEATHITGLKATATTLTWNPRIGEPKLEYRAAGSDMWIAIPVRTIDGLHGVDFTGATGRYDFRITYAVDGEVTACGGGTLTVAEGTAPSLGNPGEGQVGPIVATNASLSWPAKSGVPVFQGRRVGTEAWATLQVQTAGDRQSVDISGVEAGSYEFRIAYTDAGRTTALGAGTLTLHGGARTLSDTTTSQVGGFQASAQALTWTPQAGVARLEYRPVDSGTWLTAPVVTLGSKHGVDITGVAGTFDFRVIYEDGGRVVAVGAGRLSATAASTTPIAGVAQFQARAVGASDWQTLPVTVSGARASVDVTGVTPGEYEFRIAYTANGAQVAVGTGHATFHAPVPAQTPPPTLANAALPRVSGYSVTPSTLRWTGLSGTATVEWRAVGSATWNVATATKDGTTDRIDISGLTANLYEFRISYPVEGAQVCVGAGNLTIHPTTGAGTPTPTLANTALPNVTGFAATSAALSWTTVNGATALFEGRLVGSDTWLPLGVEVLGTTSRVSIDGLAPGDYEFRVSYSNGQTLAAFGAGNLRVPAPVRPQPTLGSTTASNITGLEATSTHLRWTPASGVPRFQYRQAGSSGEWQTLEVDTSGAKHAVFIAGANGSFDYRISYENNGAITALGTGRLDATTPTPTLANTTQANITGFTATATTLSWNKASGTPQLQGRLAGGTGAWATLTVTAGSTRDSADISMLAAGTYEFRVSYTSGGVETALATSTLTVSGASGVSNTTGSAITGLTATSTSLSWNAASGTARFEYRTAGTSTWSTLAVSSPSAGRHGVNIAGFNGSYDYRIVYETGGAITALGTGRLDASTGTPTLANTTQANITGFTATATTLSWNKASGTPQLQGRLAGSTGAWATLTVTAGSTRDSADISTLAAGTYDFRVSYTSGGVETALATSTLTVAGPSSVSGTSASVITGVTASGSSISWNAASGTARFEYRTAGTGTWSTLTVGSPSAGRHGVNVAGFNGSYDYRIVYESGGVITALGTGRLDASTGTATLASTTQANITGFTATATTLSWNKASGTPQLQGRLAGSTGAWTTLAVTAGSTRDSADISTLAAGTYDFRVSYTSGGVETALATSTLTVLGPSSVSGTSASIVTGVTANGTSISWNVSSGTARFEYRTAGTGSAWSTLTVGSPSAGRHGVSIAGLSGSYDYRIVYESGGVITALGAGRLDATTPTPTLANTTQANITGFTATATALSWNKASGTPQLQGRLAGSTGAWATLAVVAGSTRDSADISTLAAGTYDFRVSYTSGGVETALATSTLTVAGPSSVSGTAASVVTGVTVNGTSISWNAASGTARFEYRTAGSGAWSTLTVSSPSAGRHGVNVAGFSGSYDYRIVYETGGFITALGAGRLDATTPTPTLANTTQPNITGITATTTTLSWNKASGTPQLQGRLLGSTGAWATLTVTAGSTRDSADISTLAAGTYEFRVSYTSGGVETALATSTLTVSAPPAASNLTAAHVGGFAATATALSWTPAAGTVLFQYRPSTQTTWLTAPVNVVNGRATVDITGVVGTYDFRVSYSQNGLITALGTGRLSAPGSGATPTLSNTTQAHVTGVTATVTTLSWNKAAGTPQLQGRLAGSGAAWSTLTVTAGSTRDSADISTLAAGNYEFRITYTTGSEVTAIGTGNLQVSAPPTVGSTTASNVTGYSATAGELSWTPLAGTVAFQYWDTATNSWQPLTVSTVNGRHSVDVRGVVGTYNFRITYTQNGLLTGLGGGTFTAAAGSATLSNTAQADVTGISLNAGTLSWNKAAGTAQLQGRVAGSGAAWSTLTVTAGSTRDSADVSTLAAGNYEFRVTYSTGGLVTALGTGNLQVSAPPTLGSTTASNVTGYSATSGALSWTPLAGTVGFQYLDTATNTWQPFTVSTVNGRHSVDVRGVTGTYNFRITYTQNGLLTGLGNGTFTAAATSATLSNTAQADVTGISLNTGTLSWNKAAGTAQLQGRVAGSGAAWSTLTVISGSTRDSADVSTLAAGNYEFRITYTTGSDITALGTGTLQVSALPTVGSATASNVTGYSATADTLSWTPLAGTVAFQYLDGATNTWQPLTVSTVNGRHSVDVRGVAGTYNFRITYTQNGLLTGLGSGTYTGGAVSTTLANTAQADVTGISVSGGTLSWNKAAGTAQLQGRVAGSGAAWTTLPVTAGSTRDSADVSTLAAGNYEFRITYTTGGLVTALGTGNLQVSAPPTVGSATASNVTGYSATPDTLSWTPLAGTVGFQYLDTATNSWQPLTVSTVNGRHSVDVRGVAGTYNFRITYTQNGLLTGLGGGTYTSGAGSTPTLNNTTQADVTGISLNAGTLSWNKAAGTAQLQGRVAGSGAAWTTLPVTAGSTRDSADVSTLAAGNYEFRITYTTGSLVTALGTGNLQVSAPPTVGSTTASNVTGYAATTGALSWAPLAGTVGFQYLDSATNTWQPLTVSTVNGRHSVDVRGVAGTYSFRITYTQNGLLTGLGSGTFTAAAGSATLSNTAQADVTGITATATRLSWTMPASGTVRVERRMAGATAWETMTATVADGRHGVDIAAFGTGDHEFRIVYSEGSLVTAMALARLTVHPATATPSPTLNAVNAPQLAGYSATTSELSWTAVSGTPVFEGRIVGTTAWAVLPVTTSNGRGRVDLTGVAPGLYEFRLIYRSGSAIVARGAGNLTVYAPTMGTTPAPTLSNTTTANVASYAITPTQLSWARPAGTARFESRLAGSADWTVMPVTTANGRDGISLAGLAPGRYEFRVAYTVNGAVATLGSGVVTVYAHEPAHTPPPTVVIDTPPYTPAYTLPGTAGSYASATVHGNPYAVSLSGSNQAYILTQTAGAGSDSAWLRPRIEQTLDRWGNVLETNDPRNLAWKTTYRYNVNNQLIFQQRPSSTGGAGGPVTKISYDALGRQVAVRDALGNVNGQVYDAGGHLVEEHHADGGVIKHRYNAFGEKVETVDALGNAAGATAEVREGHTTRYAYDKLSRLTSVDRGEVNVYAMTQDANLGLHLSAPNPRRIVETYAYDEAGRKVTQTNGDGEVTRYRYDLAGHVIQTRKPLGGTTLYGYNAFGYKVKETDANNRTSTWVTDYYGRTTQHVDLGGATVTYEYDKAGQLVRQTSTRGQNQRFGYDAAGQLVKIEDLALDLTTTYAYDLAGNRVLERTVQSGIAFQDNHLAYDALGHLRDVADGRVHMRFDYDLNGNRTYVGTHVNVLSQAGDPSASTAHDSDRYFQYDAMNRQVVVDAENAQGSLGKQGHRITYDLNGNRIQDEFWGNRVITNGGETIISSYNDSEDAVYVTVPFTYHAEQGYVVEKYGYDNLGRLTSVERDKVQVDVRRYDGAGRVLESGPTSLPQGYADAMNQGVPQSEAIGMERRLNHYDDDGKLLFQNVYRTDGEQKYGLDYLNGYDAAGNLLTYRLHEPGRGVTKKYTSQLGYYESYVQKSLTVTPTARGATSATTTSTYDANGYLVAVDDSGNNTQDRSFTNDAQGRALLVRQNGHIQRQLIVGGEHLGRFGVGVDELEPRGSNGNANFTPVSEFSFGYQPINGNYPGASPGTYEVRQGDTLQSIARGAYGDSQLWYRIAEANGLAGDRDLRVGQTLSIPNIAGTVHNDFDSFKPYDPSKITGDTTPTLPAPTSGGGGCGALGQILMIVVAVVVTIYTAGAAAGWLGAASTTAGATGTAAIGGAALSGGGLVAGAGGFALGTSAATAVASAAIGAAAGSVASQLVGMATGVQEDFSWKGVALAAIGGGVSAGLGGWSAGTQNVLADAAIKGAAANAMTQGIAVVTGVQDKFQWKAVAAAAVGSAASAALSESAGLTQDGNQVPGIAAGDRFTKDLAIRFASGTVSAAASGGHVSMRKVAVDAFGNALGNGIVDSMTTKNTAQENFRQGEIGQQNAEQAWRQSYFHVNGADVESDNYSPVAGPGLRIGGAGKPGFRASDAALAGFNSDLDAGIREKSRAWANWDKAYGEYTAKQDAEAAARARAELPRQHARADAYRRELAEAAQRAKWDAMQVGAWGGRTNQVIPAATSPENYGPELDRSYYVQPGFIASSYQQGVSMMSNSQASWYDRVIGGAAATLMAPMMLLEEGGRALLNVPFHARMAGQNAAQFQLATSTDERVVAGLSFLSNSSAAFVGTAPLVPASVSVRPVVNAQEMAVARFPGAESVAGARASYLGDPYSPHFVGPVQWEYFYRGHADVNPTFRSSVTAEFGADVAERYVGSLSNGTLRDVLEVHGVTSVDSPFISTTTNPVVAEHYARGVSGNQPGYVTTFRLTPQDAKELTIANFENPVAFFEINSKIGVPESEYLFSSRIDPKFIFDQRQVKVKPQ